MSQSVLYQSGRTRDLIKVVKTPVILSQSIWDRQLNYQQGSTRSLALIDHRTKPDRQHPPFLLATPKSPDQAGPLSLSVFSGVTQTG